MKIDVDYIARVEGEGSVIFEIEEMKLKSLKLNIWEPPRFFEGFLIGRKYDEVPDIVSRICGICPVSHMATSIYAIEDALDFTPSEEIKKMRNIMSMSQIAASHIVHIYVLALPDYHRLDMLYGLNKEINRLLRMKEAVNNVTGLIGGRPLHPVSMVVGGFTKAPSQNEIRKMIKQLEDVKHDAIETVKIFSEIRYPDLVNDVEYVAITNDGEYAINGGIITTNSGIKIKLTDYHSYFHEKQVSYSNAKKTVLIDKNPIMVGALSRLNIKFGMLHPEARKAAETVGFNALEKNPFFNIIAQAIEIVHCICECIELLNILSTKNTLTEVKIKAGSGSSVTEAPRGMLYHQYEVNRMGVIEKANLVTPTAYNFSSLEEALKKLVTENIDRPAEELSLLCEMLVRAYDPCFSCSVH